MKSIAQKRKERQEKNEKRTYSVYAIRCKENGKVYVGCSYDVQNRIRTHMNQLRAHGKRSCGLHTGSAAWQNDYDKYGEDAFECYILQSEIRYADKFEAESYWINRLHAKEEEHGYNSMQAKLQPVPIPIIEGLPPETTKEENA